MLVIFLATLHYSYKKSGNNYPPLHNIKHIPSVYVHSENSFLEVDQFVKDCSQKYGLESICLQMDMKRAFETYLHDHQSIKTILVGIRRADPYGEQLKYIQRTDHGWPDFLRVHPVLEWHFVEVWDFLRYLEIPYCVLYDQGYTSLGGTNNTAKNPYLETGSVDENGRPLYKPAYNLTDDDKERSGRLQ